MHLKRLQQQTVCRSPLVLVAKRLGSQAGQSGVRDTSPQIGVVRCLPLLLRQVPGHIQVCFKHGQGVGGKELELGIFTLFRLGAEALDVFLIVLYHSICWIYARSNAAPCNAAKRAASC